MSFNPVEIEKMLELLEKRPGMLLTEVNYQSLCSFIDGYFYALTGINSVLYNIQFSEWLAKKDGRTSSLVWSAYILQFLAGEDEELAYTIAIGKWREFVRDEKGLF